MIIVGLVGVLFLPRVFYGLAAARALDKEHFAANSSLPVRFWNLWWPTPTEEERLEDAIQASEGSQERKPR